MLYQSKSYQIFERNWPVDSKLDMEMQKAKFNQENSKEVHVGELKTFF